MKKDIYVISKPLQYFNVCNLIDPGDDSHRTLIILGFFIDSKRFCEGVAQHDSRWHEVIFMQNKKEQYFYLLRHRCDRLFVELDGSFVLGILSRLGCFRRLYVYEEGYGSYRRDRWGNARGLKKWINRCNGVGHRVTGFSRFLTGQYLYLPALYAQLFPGYDKPLLPFRKPFLEHLRAERTLFRQLSEGYQEIEAIHHQKVGLYLSSHALNPHILEEIVAQQDRFDHFFVKPHPHLRDLDFFEAYPVEVIHSNMMVEQLIASLIDNGNQLTVYHENSTSVIWFQDRITNRNMGTAYTEYEAVASYVKDLLTQKLAQSGDNP